MRRFLLFISFCFMLLMPLSATEIIKVEEDFSTENIWTGLPKTSQSKPGTGSFTSTTTGYTYNASWSTGCYWINKNALLLGKTTGNFIEFPAFEGKVTKVEILNSTECSTKVAVKITDKNGDVIVAAKTFSTKGTTYTYDIPAEKQVEGQVLRLVLNNGNNVQISKITITIEQGEGTGGGESGPTVSAPTITAEYNQVTLACETKDATIYYTRDGSTPDENSTKYTAPFSIDAPTTVKAIAITAEGSSTVTSEELPYYITNISEFNTIADATGYKVHLTDATVAYQDDANMRIFLFDGENGVLVYGNQSDYNPGDVIATVDGDFTIYNNLPEIKNATLGEKTAGTAPTPVEATFADFTYANSNKYVVIKNVTFNSTAKTATFGDGNKLTVFSSNGMTPTRDGVYNIIGFVNIFKGTTIEIDAVEFVAKSLSFLATSMGVTYSDGGVHALPINNPDKVALTWSSSKPSVATVDAAGNVTVVGVGTTTIKAAETGNEEGNYATIEFTVSPAAGNISYFAEQFVVLTGAKFVAPVLTNPHGLTVTYASDNEAVAVVDENTGEIFVETGTADVTATITATAAAQGNYAESIASYTIVVKDAGAAGGAQTHVLTNASFIADGTTYKSGNLELNGITYQFNTSKDTNGFRLRTNNSNSGIAVSSNNNQYVLRKIIVDWNEEGHASISTTNKDRILDVYGKNTPYSADGTGTPDLFKSESQGTSLGSLYYYHENSNGKTTYELVITGDYQFIGIRSKENATYITSITLVWEAPAVPTFSATLSLSTATEGGESANVLSLSEITGTGSVELAGKNVYLNDRNICGADASATYLPYLADGVFTVVDGTTAYALNATLPDLSAITAKVESVQYFAYQDKAHELETGKWILEAEYTFELDGEYKYEFGLEGLTSDNKDLASDNNKIKLNNVGTFEVVGSGEEATLKYTTMASCNFDIQPVFPFFVKSGMSDMLKAPEGTVRKVAFRGTDVLINVTSVAQPDDTEGTGNVSGVKSVVVDSEGAVEYYNLQGVRVEGALTPGIYIRRCGNTATKISIR